MEVWKPRRDLAVDEIIIRYKGQAKEITTIRLAGPNRVFWDRTEPDRKMTVRSRILGPNRKTVPKTLFRPDRYGLNLGLSRPFVI
jgi:hypothetical protein